MQMKALYNTSCENIYRPLGDSFGDFCQFWSLHGSDIIVEDNAAIITHHSYMLNKHYHSVPNTKLSTRGLLILDSGLFEEIYLPIPPQFNSSTMRSKIETPVKADMAISLIFRKKISDKLIQIDVFERLLHKVTTWYIDLTKLDLAVNIWLGELNTIIDINHNIKPELKISDEKSSIKKYDVHNNEHRCRAVNNMTGTALNAVATLCHSVPLAYPDLMDRIFKRNILELVPFYL